MFRAACRRVAAAVRLPTGRFDAAVAGRGGRHARLRDVRHPAARRPAPFLLRAHLGRRCRLGSARPFGRSRGDGRPALSADRTVGIEPARRGRVDSLGAPAGGGPRRRPRGGGRDRPARPANRPRPRPADCSCRAWRSSIISTPGPFWSRSASRPVCRGTPGRRTTRSCGIRGPRDRGPDSKWTGPTVGSRQWPAAFIPPTRAKWSVRSRGCSRPSRRRSRRGPTPAC